MVEFVERTYEAPGEVVSPFDLAVSKTGKYIVCGPFASSVWTPRYRNSSKNYVKGADTGFPASTILSLDFSDDEAYFYFDTGSGVLQRAARSGDNFTTTGWSINMGYQSRGLDVSSSGLLVAAGVGNTVAVFRTDTQALIYTSANLGNFVEFVAFSPDGKYLLAGFRTSGLKLYKISGFTVTPVTTGVFAGTVPGNWNGAWSADSDFFMSVVGITNSSGAYGTHAYYLSNAATDAFAKVSDANFPNRQTTACQAIGVLSGLYKDVFVSGAAADGATLRAHRRVGNTLVEETISGLPTFDYPVAIKGAASGDTLAVASANGTQTLRTRVFDTSSSLVVNVAADLPFADFTAVAVIDPVELAGPGVRVEMARVFVAGKGGAIVDSAPPQFGYVEADLPFADFAASVEVHVEGAIAVDMPFADLAASVEVHVEGAIAVDMPFADFAASAELQRLQIIVAADLPGSDFEGGALPGIGANIAADTPGADMSVAVRFLYDVNVAADLPPPDMVISAGSRYEISIDADLPSQDFAADAIIEKRSAAIAADIPFSDFEASAALKSGIIIAMDSPPFEFDAAGAVHVEGTIGADLPFGDFEATITYSYRIDILASIPAADFSGLMGYPTIGNIAVDAPGADVAVAARLFYEANVFADLPDADAEISAKAFYPVTIAADLPVGDFESSASLKYRVTVSADLPVADLTAEAALTYFVQIAADLPDADFSASTKRGEEGSKTPVIGSGDSSGVVMGGGVLYGQIGNKITLG